MRFLRSPKFHEKKSRGNTGPLLPAGTECRGCARRRACRCFRARKFPAPPSGRWLPRRRAPVRKRPPGRISALGTTSVKPYSESVDASRTRTCEFSVTTSSGICSGDTTCASSSFRCNRASAGSRRTGSCASNARMRLMSVMERVISEMGMMIVLGRELRIR